MIKSKGPFALCFGFFLCSAFGQEFRASLVGRIMDASGAVVPGATVSAINQETNASVSTHSNELGNYRIPFLLPGNYRIVVELARFKKIERPGVRISVASDTTLDFVLEMGEVTQTVTVTESAPLVTSSNADLGQVVDNRDLVMATPALDRNVMNRVILVAGVTNDNMDDADVCPSQPARSRTVSGVSSFPLHLLRSRTWHRPLWKRAPNLRLRGLGRYDDFFPDICRFVAIRLGRAQRSSVQPEGSARSRHAGSPGSHLEQPGSEGLSAIQPGGKLPDIRHQQTITAMVLA